MGPAERYARVVVDRRRLVLLAFLVATLALGAGATAVEPDLGVADFGINSEATDAATYADESFEREERSVTLLVVRGEGSLSREPILETMDAQSSIRSHPDVSHTLSPDIETAGIGLGVMAAMAVFMISSTAMMGVVFGFLTPF